MQSDIKIGRLPFSSGVLIRLHLGRELLYRTLRVPGSCSHTTFTQVNDPRRDLSDEDEDEVRDGRRVAPFGPSTRY